MKIVRPKNWPHEDYPNAWMAFRRASNENSVIADWAIAQAAWPTAKSISLSDMGCGDGRVIGEIISKSIAKGQIISRLYLVEPYLPSLQAAVEDVGQISRSICVETFKGDLKDLLTNCPEQLFSVNAIICSHVVYLLDDDEFSDLLEHLPGGIPLYAVFDDPTSIFSRLWKETANLYLERVVDAHNLICTLSRTEYSVTRSDLVSEFDRQLIAPENPQASLLISMLCYNNKVNVSPGTDFGRYFAKVIDDNTRAGKVQCRFVGYEIIRKGRSSRR